jgi:hypothetical protein
VVFFCGVWAAKAAAAESRPEDTDAELRSAAEVYPANWWLRDVAAELGVAIPERE